VTVTELAGRVGFASSCSESRRDRSLRFILETWRVFSAIANTAIASSKPTLIQSGSTPT
jgi:hypothetical protein